MNDLPDEIQHIAQGFVPLGTLLSRLAQQTHNQLGDEITALAKMPAPQSTMNGNITYSDPAFEDDTPENLNKKVRLLHFVQERHGEWVKALVITNWSRKAEPVSKLIDLMHHINKTRALYQGSLDYMINIKRDLTYARLPNPDLRTALNVLAAGQAPWLPELGYIDPPPLTIKEQLHAIENLNTLLSIRLNLEEHENIPGQFQDYSIESGRVTFRVLSEFEVDLTIADEDPEKQFWFIDFRFAFTPAPARLSDFSRNFLEMKVNEALEKDGLQGCYNFLHEFVLTHKITEYVRQAYELSRGRWVDMLKVERLNRAMSIQYWSGRSPTDGPKSWIIVGVSSGQKPGSPVTSQGNSSRLTLRWFRDGKEVTNVDIPLDGSTISAEALLKRVIGKHIEHTLGLLYEGLKLKGRFAHGDAKVEISIGTHNPEDSALTMQIGHQNYTNVRIALITGVLVFQPQSNVTWAWQGRLNSQARSSVSDQITVLESLRCHYVVDELNRRGKSMGWIVCNPPVKPEETRSFLNTREHHQLMWLKRRGLPDQWYILASQSMSGDQWWLTEVVKRSDVSRVTAHSRLPLTSGVPTFSNQFFSHLTIFSAYMVSQLTLLERLHIEKIKYSTRNHSSHTLPSNISAPSIVLRLADILGRQSSPGQSNKTPSWALDFVQIDFREIEAGRSKFTELPNQQEVGNDGGPRLSSEQDCFSVTIDARIKVADPARFGALKGNVERNLAFNERLGVFAFRIELQVGTSLLDTLTSRLQALSRLAGSIDAIRRNDRDVECEEITLNSVKFSYTDRERSVDNATPRDVRRWTASLDLRANDMKLTLDSGNPQIRALEHFHALINSKEGFQKVPWFLSITLPVQRGLDAVEDAWEDLSMNDQGRVDIYMAYIDCYSVQYTLNSPVRNVRRRLSLQIKLRNLEDALQWHIYRQEPGTVKQPDDEFSKVFQKVSVSENRPWRCLNNGVAVTLGGEVEPLIQSIDESVRSLATKSPPPVPKQPHVKAPSAPRNNPHNKNAPGNNARQKQQPGPVIISLDD
ncbi:mediator complex subunit MED14 [Xylariaceae sp. FL1019]|nr:mediator complex subunit MED14 [Xylariaceae sp. FL1019]